MAKGTNLISERTINYHVYRSGKNGPLFGLATVDLPDIEAMSETVSGAGIAGEVETPTLGHFGSMTTTFNWRTIEKEAMELNQQKAHEVELRSSQQVQDAANGTWSSIPIRIAMRIVPKTLTLGSLEPGAQTDSSQEFEVMYIKAWVNNKEVLEIDKYNFVAKFGDHDALASVRSDLGLN